jgi:hypothetical protein
MMATWIGFHRLPGISLLLITALAACSQQSVSPFADTKVDADADAELGQAARSAESFIDSIGVNTHLNYTDTVYADFREIVQPSLAYLRVRHIRDALADDGLGLQLFRSLLQKGIFVTGYVPYEVTSMSSLMTNIKSQRDVLSAVEGPNEPDEFSQFTYKRQKFPEGTRAFMKDFYQALNDDPALQSLPVLQTSLAFPAQDGESPSRAAKLGDLSLYADYGNSHNYFEFGAPPGDRIATHHLPANRPITPGKPMVSSEGGYQMGNGDGYKGGWEDGLSAPFDEGVHGRYILRYLLEQYRLGYKRSFVYELIDSDIAQWGLFRSDGTPRPAADGVRAMIDLLQEGKWNATAKQWSTPVFKPGRLRYSLSKLPRSVHHVLLQKSTGVFSLIVWNDVSNWDKARGLPIASAPLSATLRINQRTQSIRTFLPLTHGTAARASVDSNVMKLQITDQPLIVEITPQSPTGP